MSNDIPEGFFPSPVNNPFAELVGPVCYRPSDDGIHIGWRAEDHHLNPGGVIHGGMLMMLVDDLMGATVYSQLGNDPKATVSLNSDFLSAAQAGDWVEGVGEITRHTRSLIFVRALLSVGDRPLLSAQAVWKFVASGHKPDGPITAPT
jgi:uncharacterized protein (TIGR00369 family)